MKSEYIFYFKNGHLVRFKPDNKKIKKSFNGLKANNKENEPKIKDAKCICNVDFNNEKEVIKLLKDFESKHKNESIEHAMVILPNGEVYTCSGNENSVMIDEIFKEKLKGACVSHNHPLNETGYTFSDLDLNLFMDYNLKKLRGIDERYTYEFTRNASEIDIMPIDWYDETAYHHCNMIRLAKEYGIGYRRWEND